MRDKTIIEIMQEKQFLRLYGNLFRCFGSIKLELHYSLLDANFYDTNRHYPNESVDWCRKNFTIKESDLLSSYWSDSELEDLRWQITNKKIIYKDYHWLSVTESYMDVHADGLSYLDAISFQFYLAAWMYQHAFNRTPNKISNEFFSFFISNFKENELFLHELGTDKIHLIIDFLILLLMFDYADKFYIDKYLKSGWLEFDGYGIDILNQFNEEKMIQDFIDRG